MLPYQHDIGLCCFSYVKQLWDWNQWWFGLALCQFTYGIGFLLYPIYKTILINFDVDYANKSWKIRKKRQFRNKSPIPVLAGKYCVFTSVHNVYAENMVYHHQASCSVRESFGNKIINTWNALRSKYSTFPPYGWPLRTLLAMIMFGTFLIHVKLSLQQFYQNKKMQNKIHHKIYHTSEDAKYKSEIFDTDSDTVVVDNAANCIVWKDKNSFIKESYKELNDSSIPMIDTAAGAGAPLGIEEVPIGWYDDNSQYHKYILKDPKFTSEYNGHIGFIENIGRL